jgi:hypothetical protein
VCPVEGPHPATHLAAALKQMGNASRKGRNVIVHKTGAVMVEV